MDTKYSTVIESICNKIKNKEIFYRGELAGILLTGSLAQERAHPHSDIDLHIIVYTDENKREYICKIYEDIIVQIQIYPFSKFVNDCIKHDRKRPANYACKLIFDSDGRCSDYLQQSSKYLEDGPARLTEQEKQVMRSKLKMEIYTAEGLILAGHNASALLIVDEMLQLAISYYNDTNHYWMTNNNFLFEELEQHDSELGILAKQIIFCREVKKKICMLKDFCRRCVENFDEISMEYFYEEEL